jgi:chloramphenicol-sensitive protein RarD
VSPVRSGIFFGVGAYGLWGVFPLYFAALEPAGPLEVLAQRISWSVLLVMGLLTVTRRLPQLRAVATDRRTLRLLALAAVLIACNWGVYIYAVHVGRVLEAALGYFITPLVSVGFGIAFFGERLRRTQAVALAFGTAAVVLLTIYYGGFPWISLILAASFGSYGLLKKLAGVGAVEGLALETLLLVVPALTYLVVLGATGGATFATHGTGHALLLVAAGPVTAIPLLLFAACVTRTPLSTVGLLQYITPSIQFLIGWLIQGEALPPSRFVGFALVWIALMILTYDGVHAARTGRAQGLAATGEGAPAERGRPRVPRATPAPRSRA